MNKSIDFLILTHNAEKFIEKLLLNIFSLKNFNNSIHRIIILDDNSQDKTIDIVYKVLIKNYILNYKIIIEKNKNGVFYNRILLLEESKADYSIFIDDDDLLENNIIDEFNNVTYKNYDLLFLKRIFCYKNKQINKEEEESINVENLKFVKYMLNKQTHMYSTGIFIKKEIIKNTLNYIDKNEILDIYTFEDVCLTLLFIILSKTIFTINSNYFYNKTNENSILTQDNKNKQREDALKIIFLITNIFNKLPNKLKKNIEYKNFLFLLKLFLIWIVIINIKKIKDIDLIFNIKNKYFIDEEINHYIVTNFNFIVWKMINHKFLMFLYFIWKKFFRHKKQ